MKTAIKTTLAMVSLSTILLMGGCKKKEEIAPSAGEPLSSTTIKGRVYADLDATTSGNEDVTSLSIIIAKVSTADLYTPSPTVPKDRFYSTTVQADGTYSVAVEAGAKPVTITVYPQDFEMEKIITSTPLKTQRKIYTSPSFNVTGIQGGVKIIDITYN